MILTSRSRGFTYGHTSEEVEDAEPSMHSMASRLGQKLTDVCKNWGAGCDLRTGNDGQGPKARHAEQLHLVAEKDNLSNIVMEAQTQGQTVADQSVRNRPRQVWVKSEERSQVLEVTPKNWRKET